GGIVCLVITSLFLKVWKPRTVFLFDEDRTPAGPQTTYTARQVLHGWLPFTILAVFVVAWGLPSVKAWLTTTSFGPLKATYLISVPLLDKGVARVPPVLPQ